MATYEKSVRTTRTSSAGYYYYKVVVTENSVNADALTSNVTADLYFRGPWDPSMEDWTLSVGIVLVGADGNYTASGSITPDIGTGYVKLLSTTKNVKHKADGTLDMVVKCWIHNANFGSVGYLPLWFSSDSNPATMGTMKMTDIPVAAEFGDVADFNFEDVISMPVSHSPFTDELRMEIGGTAYAVRDAFIGDSLALTAEELLSIYTDIGHRNTSAPVTFRLRTYKNGTLLGESTVTVTGTVVGQVQLVGGDRYVMMVKGSTNMPGVLCVYQNGELKR